jgi:hypothetical protein
MKASNNFERKIFGTIATLGFIGTFACLAPSMTGNAIGELNTDSTNFLGLIFLVIGIASIAIIRIRD